VRGSRQRASRPPAAAESGCAGTSRGAPAGPRRSPASATSARRSGSRCAREVPCGACSPRASPCACLPLREPRDPPQLPRRSWRRSRTTCAGSRPRWRRSYRSWRPTAAAAASRSATSGSSCRWARGGYWGIMPGGGGAASGGCLHPCTPAPLHPCTPSDAPGCAPPPQGTLR
jgi:hypothetical protein